MGRNQSLISMEYPWLAGECERQLGYRREQYEDELKDKNGWREKIRHRRGLCVIVGSYRNLL